MQAQQADLKAWIGRSEMLRDTIGAAPVNGLAANRYGSPCVVLLSGGKDLSGGPDPSLRSG